MVQQAWPWWKFTRFSKNDPQKVVRPAIGQTGRVELAACWEDVGISKDLVGRLCMLVRREVFATGGDVTAGLPPATAGVLQDP